MNLIDEYMFGNIISYCDLFDFNIMRQVCKQWYMYLKSNYIINIIKNKRDNIGYYYQNEPFEIQINNKSYKNKIMLNELDFCFYDNQICGNNCCDTILYEAGHFITLSHELSLESNTKPLTINCTNFSKKSLKINNNRIKINIIDNNSLLLSILLQKLNIKFQHKYDKNSNYKIIFNEELFNLDEEKNISFKLTTGFHSISYRDLQRFLFSSDKLYFNISEFNG